MIQGYPIVFPLLSGPPWTVSGRGRNIQELVGRLREQRRECATLLEPAALGIASNLIVSNAGLCT
jgi:hypothetical protein